MNNIHEIPGLEYPCGVMGNVLGFDIAVSKFELASRYCVHFWTNNFGKGIKLLISPPVS